MMGIPSNKLWPAMPTQKGIPSHRISGTALCTGCFDVLHRGHIEAFTMVSWRYKVVVGINSDAAIKRLKGPSRPINNEADRMFMVAALACVSSVLLIDSDTVDGAIREVKPDVWVKGGDWSLETLNKLEVAAANEVGARIDIVPLTAGYSSTAIINKMRLTNPTMLG